MFQVHSSFGFKFIGLEFSVPEFTVPEFIIFVFRFAAILQKLTTLCMLSAELPYGVIESIAAPCQHMAVAAEFNVNPAWVMQAL